MGKVYLLGERDNDKSFKIGATRGSVEKRIKSLQTGNSGEIYQIAVFETKNPFLVEGWLHRRFHQKKLLNEWYSLSDVDVRDFLEICQNIQKQIDSLKDNYFFEKKLN